MSLQNQFIKYFTSKEYTEVTPSPSQKYRQLVKPGRHEGNTLWIGKKGAVRMGVTASKSKPLAPMVLDAIKEHLSSQEG